MIKISTSIFVLMAFTFSLHAQSITPEQRATQIAQIVKDSLNLSEPQRIQLYTLNLPLANMEGSLRKQFAGASSMRYYLIEMELIRDSLYKGVLPTTKYLLYKAKKINLINHNAASTISISTQ